MPWYEIENQLIGFAIGVVFTLYGVWVYHRK